MCVFVCGERGRDGGKEREGEREKERDHTVDQRETTRAVNSLS